MVYELFISYAVSQLDRVIDYISESSKRDLFVKSAMKEALLGCCVDWRTRSEFFKISESNDKLKRYAEMLNTVTVKFHCSGMLSLPLCERIWECTREMVAIAEGSGSMSEFKLVRCGDHLVNYDEVTAKVIADLNSMYADFDKLYEQSKKELKIFQIPIGI